ncbi:MAG TPA: hypothetical protein PLD82_07760 [Spirochaetota bacterium]|nr:hypothetical protein [Spirochaetota bacterium]
MRSDSPGSVRRSHGTARQTLVLLLAPLVALVAWWAVLCFSLNAIVFPPAWLLVLFLVPPLALACVLLVVSRAVVFGFYGGVTRRIRQTAGLEGDEGDATPFFLFHSGQELEMLTGVLASWKQEVAVSRDRLAGVAGLWSLEPQARFPWAGRSRVYQLKSNELKKAKGYTQVRRLACLAVFIAPPGEETGIRKRFEWMAEVSGSIAGMAEENGGFVALVMGRVLLLVFSLGSDERTLAIRAVKTARNIQELLAAEFPGSTVRMAGDIFQAVESMVQVPAGLRYHIEAPEIAALRLAAGNAGFEGGLRLTSRLVASIKTGEAGA